MSICVQSSRSSVQSSPRPLEGLDGWTPRQSLLSHMRLVWLYSSAGAGQSAPCPAPAPATPAELVASPTTTAAARTGHCASRSSSKSRCAPSAACRGTRPHRPAHPDRSRSTTSCRSVSADHSPTEATHGPRTSRATAAAATPPSAEQRRRRCSRPAVSAAGRGVDARPGTSPAAGDGRFLVTVSPPLCRGQISLPNVFTKPDKRPKRAIHRESL